MNNPPTLAEKWLRVFDEKTRNRSGDPEIILRETFRAFHGLAIGPIVEDGVKTGIRYLFNDTSYADFYFEVSAKGAVFTGTGGDLDVKYPSAH